MWNSWIWIVVFAGELIVVDAFIFWLVLGMLLPFQVANEGWGSPTKNVTKLVLTVAGRWGSSSYLEDHPC